jgi:hypothetical protein
MSDYTFYFTTTASTSVTVEADNLDDAIDKAYGELGHPSVCAQCSGMFSDAPGIDIGGDWELDEEAARDDYPDQS